MFYTIKRKPLQVNKGARATVLNTGTQPFSSANNLKPIIISAIPSSGSLVPPGIYSSRSNILTPLIGKPVYILLSEEGYFRAEVNAGNYLATVSNCVFLGCDSSLPVKVSIMVNESTIHRTGGARRVSQ